MKLFNNLQELWAYALYCPICERYCRNIVLSLNPDEIFLPDPIIEKSDDYLVIKFIAAIKNQFNSFTKINGLLKINCLDNSFEFLDVEEKDFIALLIKKLNKSNFSFDLSIQSYCECTNTSTYFKDIEIDLFNKSLKDIKLESESVNFVIDNSERYMIIQLYDERQTFIDKYCTLDNGSSKYISSYKNRLLNIDFFDLKKAFTRVKTILVFS